MTEQPVHESELGTFTVRRIHDPAAFADRYEVLQADERIAISRELLIGEHDPAGLVVRGDGEEVTICGEYVYRATGQFTWHGDPVYTLTTRPAERVGQATTEEDDR